MSKIGHQVIMQARTLCQNEFPIIGHGSRRWESELMIICIKNMFLIGLIAGFGFLEVSQATAGSFTILHSFNGGSDGDEPYAGLTLSGNTLYGTTSEFDSLKPDYNGTVFSISTDGTGFTNLHDFRGDGFGTPLAELTLSDNTLYGTTIQGGYDQGGTVFKLNTDGSGFTNLYEFSTSDGARPRGRLLLSGGTLYGTTSYGGVSGNGTVFALSTNGSCFSNLYTFSASGDGGYPFAGLVLSSNTLYGTTYQGGRWKAGTVFGINTDGTGYTNVYDFTGGNDGALPIADLVLSGNTLYGTAGGTSISNRGTVFAVNTDGTNFRILHTFSGGIDGDAPSAGLFLFGSTLYGTTPGGGSGHGTVFAVNTNGNSFMSLYSFTGGTDGAAPVARLILWDNALYGTANRGGNSGAGTVFTLSPRPISAPPPQLMIKRSGTDIVLSWPSNVVGFTLQSATNLISPVWTTDSPAPVVVDGQNAVTNPISGTQHFFRLGH
jgi:uncharacterized repeat protein (TIGR03803 family)